MSDLVLDSGDFPWTVDYVPDTLEPGARYGLVGAFLSEEDASAFIGYVMERRDPDGVTVGRYGICGPNEDGEVLMSAAEMADTLVYALDLLSTGRDPWFLIECVIQELRERS